MAKVFLSFVYSYYHSHHLVNELQYQRNQFQEHRHLYQGNITPSLRCDNIMNLEKTFSIQNVRVAKCAGLKSCSHLPNVLKLILFAKRACDTKSKNKRFSR